MSGDPRPGASAGDDRDFPEDIGGDAQHVPLPLVPPSVSRSIRSLDPSRRPILSAELVVDTRVGRDLAGVRGGTSSAWTLSYTVEGCDVFLDVVPTGSCARLTGQLLSLEDLHAPTVRLYRDDHLVSVTASDEVGQFDVGTIDMATYHLMVSTPGRVIDIAIDLGAGGANVN